MKAFATDFSIIGVLIFLECILSIDNAVALAILARTLPRNQQNKALTYGLIGAIISRFIFLLFATQLVRWHWIKYAAGLYLVFIAIKHFLKKNKKTPLSLSMSKGFWKTVLMIEFTDIAFGIDSILAAIALTPKLWIIFVGGGVGIIIMRFAASSLVSLMNRLPQLETVAYLLVLDIGVKTLLG